MNRMRSSLSALLACTLAISCGGGPAQRKAGAQRPAIESRVPSLRWVPAEAEYVIVGRKAQEALFWMQKGASLLSELSAFSSSFSDGGVASMLSFLAGLDVGASASVFGDAHSLTAILPVSSEAAIPAFQTQFRESGATENTYGEYRVLSDESPQGRWSSTTLAGNLVLHFDFGLQVGGASSGGLPSWLGAIVQAGKGTAYGHSLAAKRVLASLPSEIPPLWGSADGLLQRMVRSELDVRGGNSAPSRREQICRRAWRIDEEY